MLEWSSDFGMNTISPLQRFQGMLPCFRIFLKALKNVGVVRGVVFWKNFIGSLSP